jgi:hypothetical protein
MTATALWSTKARSGHPLHRICAYQGSFPPQIPAYFLDRYPAAETVLDPFCGRGTTVLEATLRRKTVYGCDAFAVARCLSSVKLRCTPQRSVLAQIEALDLSGSAPEPPSNVKPFFHPETWRQLWNLRERNPGPEVMALALGRLHGHSPGFFSTKTFNVISVSGSSLEKACAKHGTQSELRDVKKILVGAAKRFIPELALEGRGEILQADARELPLPDASVDLVVTSPPFFDTIDYEDVNWLRDWFLNQPSMPTDLAKTRSWYVCFLDDIFWELGRVLKKNAHVVFEVGPVRRQDAMSDLVLEAAQGAFEHEETLVNSFEGAGVPKISRAMNKGRETKTMENQCVILKRK